ncbi:MFS transporter [Mesoaciditoga sp.]
MGAFAFWWHMAFLSFASTMINVNTVIPSYLDKLYHSSFLIGIASSILLGLPSITQLFFANFLKTQKYKKPYLMGGILTRAFAIFLLSLATFYVFSLGIWGIILILTAITLFATTGSFAGIAYVDLLGKSVPREKRYYFFPIRQAIAGVFSFMAGFVVKYVLSTSKFPHNYGVLFLFASISVSLAVVFFLFLKESPSEPMPKTKTLEMIRSIPEFLKDRKLFWYVIVEVLGGFYFMALPFFAVYTIQKFNSSIVGNLVIFQVTGMVLSNLLWGYVSKKMGNVSIARIGIMIAIISTISTPFLPNIYWYYILFFVVGTTLSARGIFMDAYLIEIAPERERVMYVGISGTMGFVGALFPILGGLLARHVGFTFVFVLATAGLVVDFLSALKLEAAKVVSEKR